MIARIRKSMEEKDQGFTLIELLVVMIIIGILAAIAVPVFLNQRKSAVDSAVKSDIRTVATLAETIYVNTQAYPTAAVTLTKADTSWASQPVRISEKSSIAYKTITDGFCITGTAVTGAGTGTSYYYNSATGGMTTTAC